MNIVIFIATGIIVAAITIAVMSYIFRNYFAAIPLHPPGNMLPFARALSGDLPDISDNTQGRVHEPKQLSSFLGGGELLINPEHLVSAYELNLEFNFLLSPEFFADRDALLAEYLPVVIDGQSTGKFGLNNGDLAWVCKRAQSRAFQAGDIVLIKKNKDNQHKDHALKARRLYAKKSDSDSKWTTLAYGAEEGSEAIGLQRNEHYEEDFIGVFAYKVCPDGSARKFKPNPFSEIIGDLQQHNLEPPST